jgi:hypothetical protein
MAAPATGRSRLCRAVQLNDLRAASATTRMAGGVDIRTQAEKTKDICVHRCDGNRVHHTCFLDRQVSSKAGDVGEHSVAAKKAAKGVPQYLIFCNYKIKLKNGATGGDGRLRLLPVGMQIWQLDDILMPGAAFFIHFRCVIARALLIDPPFVGDFFAMVVPAPVTIEQSHHRCYEKKQSD